MTARLAVLFAGALAGVVSIACGAEQTQVRFVSNEQPNGYNAQGGTSPGAAHRENPNGGNGVVDLGEDDLIEPEHPAAETKPERAMVHIHGPSPKDPVCTGVVIAPRLVATAQRCIRGVGKGAVALGADRPYRVEIASSTLTWTNRRAKYAVLPQCDETELDVAILVLEEPAPSLVTPLKIVSSPNTGAAVQALGFGHCKDSKTLKERTGTIRSRVAQAVVIDVPLCKGDVGGPVIHGRDEDGEIIGLISHRDDPEGSPLKTATIARLDTTWARDLIVQAKLLVEGAQTANVQSVACR